LTYPERVYTEDEVKKAKQLVDAGYKHDLAVKGELSFTAKVSEAIELLKTAGYYDFIRSYIRQIKEIDGLTQLRETEASIWANKFAVENPVDFASLIVQKAYHMKEYLDGEIYYGGNSEKRTTQKRIDFLGVLKEKSQDASVQDECTRLLELWRESSIAY